LNPRLPGAFLIVIINVKPWNIILMSIRQIATAKLLWDRRNLVLPIEIIDR
jgi:hypothetical protein